MRKKMSIVIPDDLVEWAEYRAYERRISLTAYIIGQVRADYEGASPEEIAKFEAAKATREAPTDAQGQAEGSDE